MNFMKTEHLCSEEEKGIFRCWNFRAWVTRTIFCCVNHCDTRAFRSCNLQKNTYVTHCDCGICLLQSDVYFFFVQFLTVFQLTLKNFFDIVSKGLFFGCAFLMVTVPQTCKVLCSHSLFILHVGTAPAVPKRKFTTNAKDSTKEQTSHPKLPQLSRNRHDADSCPMRCVQQRRVPKKKRLANANVVHLASNKLLLADCQTCFKRQHICVLRAFAVNAVQHVRRDWHFANCTRNVLHSFRRAAIRAHWAHNNTVRAFGRDL